MVKSSAKAPPAKAGRDNPLQKKGIQSPSNARRRRTRKKNKKTKEKTANDLFAGARQQIDFSQYAAGSSTANGNGKPLAFNEDEKEPSDRAETPPVDNRQNVARQSSFATMTDEQKRSFVPVNKFQSPEGNDDEDIEESSNDDDPHKGSPSSREEAEDSDNEDEQEEGTEQEGQEDIDETDSKMPATKNSRKRSPRGSNTKDPASRSRTAQNPYSKSSTSMEIDPPNVSVNLDAGPKDAVVPRQLFRKIIRRVDIKVTAQGSTQSDVELVNQIKAVMAKLQEADKSIVVLPYLAADRDLKPLQKLPTEIPSGIGKLKKYFQNATPRMNGGSYYVRALLCFNKSFDETTEDIKWWLGENKAGIWMRKIQEEKVTRLGYLLYSLRSMDVERLTRVFSQRYRTKIGIRYQVINTGRRGKYDPDIELPRAIHIEVESSQAARVATLLQQDYSSAQSTFPMGIKMRFVPDINQLMNFETRSKSVYLATRQMAFEEKICYANSWEIMNIYSVDSIVGLSVAEMITSIPSFSTPHLNIFHSVTPGYQAGSTTFAFIPQLESEARTMVAALLPFLHHHYGDSVFKHFTPVACDRAMTCHWDPETNQVVSPQDQAVEEATALDEEFHFTAIQDTVIVNAPVITAAPTGGTAAFAKDTDSCSTFRQPSKRAGKQQLPTEPTSSTSTTKKAPQRDVPSKQPTNSDDHSTNSTTSGITLETLESTVQTTVLNFFQNEMQGMIQQAIATSMQQMHGLAVSANTQQDSDAQQIQASSSGTSHQQNVNDESVCGSSQGASASG